MNRQKKKGSKIKMFLETTEPTKSDDTWEMTAIATVLYQNRPPVPAQEVVFLLNGDEVDRVPTNDENGQAKSTIVLPSAGSYLLCVYSVRWPGIQRTKRISVKKAEKKAKTAAGLVVTFAGKRGKQILMIAVAGEDGSFIPNFTGKIMDGDKFHTFITGLDGTCEYKTNFRDKERAFRVWVGNKPDQIWSNVFLGPK